jgi:hypothetical protein
MVLRGLIVFPFPMILSGVADVCEWYDDAERQFQDRGQSNQQIVGAAFRL